MKEEPTTNLLNILNHLDKQNLDSYILEHSSTKQNINIFSEYIAANNITTAFIVNRCTGFISKSYIYDVLNGIKTQPSRDIIIATYTNNKDFDLDSINDELARYQLPLLNAQ